MKARLVKFGEIEVEGKRYTHDVVIDGDKVRKRKKERMQNGVSPHYRHRLLVWIKTWRCRASCCEFNTRGLFII